MESNIGIEQKSRIEKLAKIKRAGIDPYPSKTHRSHKNQEALDGFDSLAKPETKIFLTGRLKLLRPHGGSTFAHIEDESGKIQIYFQKDTLGDEPYARIKNLDLGDFIEVQGTLFLTKKQEKTLKVTSFEILCKTIRPLPEKWHGLKDQETRYRQRYLDLIMNEEVRHTFQKRSLFIKTIREVLERHGFMEVETPVLELVPGGAEAKPFITHHNTLDMDLYLRISLELHLKRLMVGGFEKIYEIGKVFRNEGMSTQHLQEFTELEFYWAYADWQDAMKLIEELCAHAIKTTFGTLKIKTKDHELDFTPPWPRVNYVETLTQKTGIDIEQYPDSQSLSDAIKEKNIVLEDFEVGRGRLIDQLYKKKMRPDLIQPQFLINHPVDVSPLSKRDAKHQNRTERFQLLANGCELVNAFSELNDPIDQRQRFEQQAKLREAGDSEAYMFDEDFVQAIEHGLPPTAGFGMGIDRFFMLLSGAESIRDVVFFPIMKPIESTEIIDSEKKPEGKNRKQ